MINTTIKCNGVSTEPIWHVKSMLTAYSLNSGTLFKQWLIQYFEFTADIWFLIHLRIYICLDFIKSKIESPSHRTLDGLATSHLVCSHSALHPCIPKPRAYCQLQLLLFCWALSMSEHGSWPLTHLPTSHLSKYRPVVLYLGGLAWPLYFKHLFHPFSSTALCPSPSRCSAQSIVIVHPWLDSLTP